MYFDKAVQGPSPSPSPTPPPLTIEPSQAARGGDPLEVTITINSDRCAGTFKFTDKDQLANKDKLKGIILSDVTVVDDTRCKLTATLTTANDAPYGSQDLVFNLQNNKTATVSFTIVKEAPLPPGPLPPGLKPQVDIMWGVVPKKIVADNFGRRVAQNFYCIEIVIGNNTGYDLQIASVGFNLGPVGDTATLFKKRFQDKLNDTSTITVAAAAARQTEADAIEAEAQADKDGVAAALARQLCAAARNTRSEKGRCSNSETAQRAATASRQAAIRIRSLATEARKRVATAVQEKIESVRNDALEMTATSRTLYSQKIPVSSYMMTRGSLEHGQIWSPRNLIINGLKAFGPFLTGFTPYFHVLNHRNNFSEGINIISNPFEKGYEAVVPDETISQLQRLDEQILRDGLIIPNNRQIRTRVFVPKELLRLGKDLDGNDMRNDPMMVNLALGEMYLIGNTVAYLNRVSVTSGPSGEVTPPPTVTPGSFQTEFDLAEESPYSFSLTGTNLKDARLTSDDSKTIVISNVSTTNTSLTAQMGIKDTARLGTHTLSVTNARSTVQISITVTQPPPQFEKVTTVPTIAPLTPEKKTYPVNIEGRFLQGADLVPSGANNPLTASDVKAAPDGKSLSANIVVPPNTPPGEYTFVLTNEQHKDTTPGENNVVTFKTNDRPEKPELTTPSEHPTTADAEIDPKDVKYNRVTSKSYTVKLHGKNLNNIASVESQDGSTSKFSDFSTSNNGQDLTMKFTLSLQDEPSGANLDQPKKYKFRLKDSAGQSSDEDFAIEVKPQDVVSNVSVSSAPVEMSTEQTIVVSGQNLDGATLTPDASNPPNWEITALSLPNENPSQMTVKIKALPAANFIASSAPVTLKFKVSNTNKSHEELVTITVKFKAP